MTISDLVDRCNLIESTLEKCDITCKEFDNSIHPFQELTSDSEILSIIRNIQSSSYSAISAEQEAMALLREYKSLLDSIMMNICIPWPPRCVCFEEH